MARTSTVPKDRISCGLELNVANDLYNATSSASSSGYSFIVLPLVHPRFRREFLCGKALNRPGAFTRSDLLLNSQDWTYLIAGKLSPWINVDSAVETVRKNSERALEQEINYAIHLGLPTIILSLVDDNCINLARLIHNKIALNTHHASLQLWVHVPMRAPQDESSVFLNAEPDNDSFDVKYAHNTWDWWNIFRAICNHERRIGLALELSSDLPNDQEMTRWYGEPVRCIVIPTSIFLTNRRGYPVLTRAHQSVLKRFFKLKVQVLIKGVNRHQHIKNYQQYIDHLWKTQEPDDVLARYAKGYEDYLQIPLQPLMDNLESTTYETFEKDPIKYIDYQKAMYAALLDIIPDSEASTREIVLMVVGAGRGPLVRAALTAARNADRKIKVYAVEKNPNAVVTLQVQQDEMWGDQVTVVSCDMREWDAPEKADILVSELLGSFGDNELSPECLDGAQKFLKEGGISIPAQYTSFLAPVSSPKLYAEVSVMREKDKHPLTFFEMPYVVHFHNRTEIVKPEPLFTFEHPNFVKYQDNSRYKKLVFEVPYDCTIHGFAGYFDTVLYKDIKLSIVPESHSIGMFSWFPIFFPLKDPLYLKGGQELEVHFWRCTSKRNVWYEWLVTKPTLGTVHNPNGRSYTIGL